MIAQYVIVALAVLLSLAWLARHLLSAWTAPRCADAKSDCCGCEHARGGACASPEPRLVQLRKK